MGLSLNVYLVFGVEVPTSKRRALDALDNHASVEVAPVGDCDRLVVFVRESHVNLASGTHYVRHDVFDASAHATLFDHRTEAWAQDIAAACRGVGVHVATSACSWLVVSSVR